ncbi:MAG: J domain-containing protein [Pirellulaceae bacterium]|nr:J domain-containing protein [Pirellulaceae bacterium]
MADWSLLPTQPLAFFELAPNFDRKDLKRAYGKLIKQYKPETHPVEFQRIREAYELLEGQNRYGVVEAQMRQAADAWTTTDALRPDQPASSERKAREDLPDTEASAEETYQRLKAQASKTPQTYFALATLSDLVESPSSNMYLKWLLTGIKAFPSDPGLLRLVSEYLSAFTEPSAAAATLQTIAKLVAGDDFYRVTEPLWNRLIDEGEFEAFAKTLDTCERLLKHRSLRPKLAFYIHVLRLAMWKAPLPWTEERLKFIEAHGSELASGMDEEIELLKALFKYRHHDRSQIANSAVGAKVDQLIAAYCKGNSLATLSEVALLCDELARNGNGWQQTFPASETAKHYDTLWLCMLILSDVAQQTGVGFGQVNQLRMQQQADATVSDIVKTVEEISSRIYWLRARLYGTPLLVYWLGPLILTFGWSYWGAMLVIWSLLAVLSFVALAVPFYLKKKVDARIEKLIEKEYEKLWRPRMFRYVQACHTPAQNSIAELQKSAHDLGQSNIVELVLAYAFGDRAMHLFNFLQLFVH